MSRGGIEIAPLWLTVRRRDNRSQARLTSGPFFQNAAMASINPREG
jgi:hypothetical protein